MYVQNIQFVSIACLLNNKQNSKFVQPKLLDCYCGGRSIVYTQAEWQRSEPRAVLENLSSKTKKKKAKTFIKISN